MAVTSPSSNASHKNHWWLTNRKIVAKYIKEARALIATLEQSQIASALTLLDAALAIYPRHDTALELKARSLLFLRRFKEVADMLQDYIPILKVTNEDSSSFSSDNSSHKFSREGVKFLSFSSALSGRDQSFKCFSVSDLKKRVMAGLFKSSEEEGQWSYSVLGKACFHLGLMEDAMVLLQTSKRIARDAFRRESICWSDDSFFLSAIISPGDATNETPSTIMETPLTEFEGIAQLLNHIKLLLRRRTAALAAHDAGLYSEAIRHFSKIIDGRHTVPQGFLAECHMLRASSYRSAGRIAEAIADCNRTLAFDPSCIQALDTRASLLETIRCLPDCLHDLEHLKLLYNSILRDRKLPGPAWKRHNVKYREIPGKLRTLTTKIQELKRRVASGETKNVDYYALIRLPRGCSRSELERAYRLLCLRHKPDKALNFTDRCELADERDLESVKERAKMSVLLLYRLLQKGYTSIMATIIDEEAVEKQRKKAAELQAAQAAESSRLGSHLNVSEKFGGSRNNCAMENIPTLVSSSIANSSVFQGAFCRDVAAVGNLLSSVAFNNPISVKFEALSC
ncbi:hypothetical protein QN277_013914 [Acacia crassicarpa]|uniref:J domain-containing protein n=1 Tax=Acacia crassicarpa TaxID=499986 RepID=A0AAE1N3M0_9FABA|nr:hypothetical protein QN277_013914 [Acacia crassicarpa]